MVLTYTKHRDTHKEQNNPYSEGAPIPMERYKHKCMYRINKKRATPKISQIFGGSGKVLEQLLKKNEAEVIREVS